MASVQRFRLKQTPTDVWSVKERLALACSVMRSGDQNWVSVSRSIKPYGEPNRPPDWFSQKNCALQYADLLEKVETPKRKRAERSETETPGSLITRKLTIDRNEELKQIIKEEQQKYKKLKLELETCKAGQYDDRIKEYWEEMVQEKKAREEAMATVLEKAKQEAEARQAALAARVPGKPVAYPNKVKKQSPGLKLKIGLVSEDESTQDSMVDDLKLEDEGSNLSSGPPTSVTSTDVARTPTSFGGEVKTVPRSPILSTFMESSKELKTALEDDTQDAPYDEIEAEVKMEAMETENSGSTMDVMEIKSEPASVEIKQEDDIEESQSGNSEASGSTDVVVDTASNAGSIAGDGVKSTQPSPVAVPVSAVTSLSVKSEAPSSPSVVAPTLSRLLVTPPIVALVLPSVPTKAPPKEKSPSVPAAAPSTEVPPPPVIEKRETRVSTGGGKTHTVRLREKSECSEKDDPIPPQHTGGKGPLLSMQPVGFDEPASPASSVVSNETDSGSTKNARSSSRKGRGKGRPNLRRSSGRLRGRTQEGSIKDGEDNKPSDVETSDDENVKDESDYMPMTPRAHTSISESVPNSPAQSSDTEDEKAHRVWKKSIMLVWRAAANHKYANVFLHPVTDDIAPGYSNVVSRPMDLMTIKRNIETGMLRTTAEFQRDMMIMFTNAIMYNNSDHNVYNMAIEMYDDVLNHIEQFVNTQMMVSAEAKVLRPSRRSEAAAMSDKEEDPKKRKVPEIEAGGKAKKRK